MVHILADMEYNLNDYSWVKLPSQVMQQMAIREKALRKMHGMTMAQLAKHSGVSLGSLKRFELSGQISLESLLKLAFTLNCLGDFDNLFLANKAPKSLDDLFK